MKLALLDADRTLRPGYISMEFLDFLNNKDIIPKESYNSQMNLLESVKSGDLPYEDWCMEWGIEWGLGYKGNGVQVIQELANAFFQEAKKSIYPASYGVVDFLKNNNYHVVCLSTGGFELSQLIANELNMDYGFGTEVDARNGIYTGNLLSRLHLPGGKREIALRLMERYKCKDSVGMGDSGSDIEFLDLVDIPIACNPNQELKDKMIEKKYDLMLLKNLTYAETMANMEKIIQLNINQ